VLALAFPADRPPSTVPDEGPADAMFQATHPGGGVELDQSYYRWEVRIKADVAGVDLDRTFRLRVAPGSGATWAPAPVPQIPRVPLDRTLERRLDERRAIERKLSAACFVIGIAPFLVPFVIAGLGVGLAGCPMGWSNAAPPQCELAGINWGALMAGTFDLVSVAVPAGIAASTVLYLAGQAWLNRTYSRGKESKTRR
jgi:nitroreductase